MICIQMRILYMLLKKSFRVFQPRKLAELLALWLVIIGLFFDNTEFLVYGYCISLVYRAALKLVSAFRKTTFVYIQ